MPRSLSCLPALLLGASLAFGPFVPGLAELLDLPHGQAQAQDDDDDDDDDRAGGADRDDDPPPARVTRPPVAQKTAAPAAPPAFAPELVVSDLAPADLDLLLAEGFTLIERRTISTLALTLDRLAPPRGLTLPQARDRVRRLSSGGDADFNHFYRSASDDCTHENCPAWEMVGWPEAPDPSAPVAAPALPEAAPRVCGPAAPIGVIDTGINPDHEILTGADLTLIPSAAASGAVHGTAVVSLLIGRKGSRVPGLVPEAQVLAVDVFRKDQGEERADVADLVQGLDLLAGRGLRLYALSLAGPENRVLVRMLDRLTDPLGLDAVVVAAAGNGGPGAEPAWPAAHPGVLAVTAVDRRGRVYGQAQRGDHLGLAAPGVGLLAATSVRGAKAKSGTSFAVPFVVAAAAQVLGSGTTGRITGAEVRAALTGSARDLGAPGRDAVFGHGLLDRSALCGE